MLEALIALDWVGFKMKIVYTLINDTILELIKIG